MYPRDTICTRCQLRMICKSAAEVPSFATALCSVIAVLTEQQCPKERGKEALRPRGASGRSRRHPERTIHRSRSLIPHGAARAARCIVV